MFPQHAGIIVVLELIMGSITIVADVQADILALVMFVDLLVAEVAVEVLQGEALLAEVPVLLQNVLLIINVITMGQPLMLMVRLINVVMGG